MSLFQPEYGEKFKVTPKRWWSPKDRKAARLAARVADYHANEIYGQAKQLLYNEIVYGTPFVAETKAIHPYASPYRD